MIRKMSIIGFAIALIFALAGSAVAWPVPDTGQTKCYDNSGEIPCPQPGEPFYGQDGNYTINPPSYTKLGQNGVELPDDATSWLMVRDNVTGLIWEVKQNKDGVQDYTNPNDADNTYTWYDSNPETNGGNAGTPGDGTDTEDFINALNVANFGGFSDWRLPTKMELRTIVDYKHMPPGINTVYFPDGRPGGGWSSTSQANSPSFAWCVYVTDEAYMKALSRNVRAVRATQGEAGQFGVLIDYRNGTIGDLATGLMWQKQDDGQQRNWEGSLSYCENLSLAGYEDWRLPNAKELASLVDLGRYLPSIDPLFSETKSAFYWTSTTQDYNANCVWILNFAYGDYGGGANFDSYKSRSEYVRCVRLGYDSSGNGNADIGLDTWQQRASGTTNDLEKVIFAQDQFVAVGYGGTVLSSPDGVTWTLRSQGSHVIKDIAYGNGVYVAVGGSGTGGPGTIGKIWTSVDLENWTDQNLGDISWRYSIAYGGGIFVAGGDFSDIQISPDGYMWTKTNWPLAWYLNSITYGDNRFIGVTAGRGYIGSSVNGRDWIEVAQYDAWWMSVTYGSGLFVSAGGRLAWDGPNIAISHDATAWAEKSIDMNVMEVTHGNGFFVGVGAEGKISSSENGTVWTPRNSGVSQRLAGVAYGRGTFVAVGENGTIIQTGCIAFEPGDVNRDCEVNLTDAITILQVVAGMSPSVPFYKEADVNTDGKLSIEDAIYVLQIVSGLR